MAFSVGSSVVVLIALESPSVKLFFTSAFSLVGVAFGLELVYDIIFILAHIKCKTEYDEILQAIKD